MAPPLTGRTLGPKISLTLLGSVAVFVTAFFAWIVWQRIGYRFELEWMEGAMADHVCRVLEGELIYCEPSFEHVAYLYHPGFFYVAALLGLITGPGFLALRLVSLLATLGSCVLVFRLVRRDGNAVGGAAAAALFLAAFSLTGCYYDVGRIDALFTFLLLLGIDLTRSAATWKGLAAATVAFLLCWLTKQTAAVILPFVVLGCLPRGWRYALVFGAVVAGTCGVAVWLLDLVHDGWMSFFTLELPRGHGILPQYYIGYWTSDLLPLVPAIGLLVLFLARSGERRTRVFHGLWIGGCVVGSYLSRLHIGGAENVLIPVVAALSVGCGLGLARLERPGGKSAVLGHVAVIAQLVIVFALPWFGRPIPRVPWAELKAKGDRHLAGLSAMADPVFLPWHGYTARMAGKPPTAHLMAMDDVWRSGDQRVIDLLNAAIRARLTTAPHPVIYIDKLDANDSIDHHHLRELILGAGYRRDPSVQIEALPPLVGARDFPRGVWRR